ncbi:MAG: ABC transporter ATP-binding protein [Evtepia sp.]
MNRSEFKPVEHPDHMSSYWKRQWPVLLCVTIGGLCFDGAMPYAAILQGHLIDAIALKQSLRYVIEAILFFLAAVAVIQLMRYCKRYFVRLFANRTTMDMRLMLFNHIMHKDLSELQWERSGDLMVKAVSDVDICVEGMRKVTTEFFDTGVLMVSYLITMFWYDWGIAALACIFLPLAMYLAEYLKTVIVKYAKASRIQTSRVADLTYSNIEQIQIQRMNGLEESRHRFYAKELDELEKRAVKASILESSMQPIYNVIAMLGIVFVLYLGGKNVIAGIWTVGTFSACISIFIALSIKASKAAKLFNAYQKAKVSWQRIRPYLSTYHQADDRDVCVESGFDLCVSDLAFSYPGTQHEIVSNLSFTAEVGQIIGVTGPVACGKSTLGVALSGLYPYSGSIQLCGMELRTLTAYQRSQRIAMQFHDPQLLSDSIYHNITLGEAGDITTVLQHVCFEEDLKSMPQGIETLVGSGGVRLSGGQQARIALARALYHKCKLILLDDPFSAVDLKTEQKIIQNLREHYRDSIIILISHRLAIFPIVDRILLMDEAHTSGTHRELLEESELYQNLYALQQSGDENEAK